MDKCYTPIRHYLQERLFIKKRYKRLKYYKKITFTRAASGGGTPPELAGQTNGICAIVQVVYLRLLAIWFMEKCKDVLTGDDCEEKLWKENHNEK